MSGGYAITYLGPGHVVMSRRSEDIEAAWLEELRPALEAFSAAYELDRWWWARQRRARSRAVTRRKQRQSW